jgi:hypothetical protein
MILEMAGKERAGLMARVCRDWRAIVRTVFYNNLITEESALALASVRTLSEKLANQKRYKEYMEARKVAWPPVLYAENAVESVALLE